MFVLRAAFLSLRPRLERSGEVLEITTSFVIRVASAFSYRRSVLIDRRRRIVRIVETKAWFFTTVRQLRFEEVDHLAYSFSAFWTSWDFRGRVHDLYETFTITLKLKSSEELRIVRYPGHGAAGDVSTWMMGDDLIDMAGTQAEDSRALVGQLVELLGVPLGPRGPAPRADAEGRTYKCSACGRAVAPKPRCIYCGGEAGPSVGVG